MSPAKTVPEGSLGTRMILAVAISYVIDGALLAGFATTGTIGFNIPLAYTAIGLLDASVFLALHAWAVRHGATTANSLFRKSSARAPSK